MTPKQIARKPLAEQPRLFRAWIKADLRAPGAQSPLRRTLRKMVRQLRDIAKLQLDYEKAIETARKTKPARR